MKLFDDFKNEADELFPELTRWRRDFHQHPELGFREKRTAGIVADHLRELGLEVATGIGETGVVAVVEGEQLPHDAPTVLLRFDMDALPIQEQNELPYLSENDGVMHACGHDGHTAIGMGVAQILTRHRRELAGRVKLVFQPAEEGLGGARAMIADGVLADPAPSAAFGLHLWNQLPLNQIVVQSGPLWASSGTFRLVIHGQGGHGAAPHQTVDATLIASQIVVALQSIVARSVDPADSAVISVGAFHSGDAFNVISGEAELRGTIRSFDERVEALLHQRIEEIASGICQAFGASYELEIKRITPVTQNSEEGARLMQGIAEQLVGSDNVIQITPMTVGEDMAEFLNRAPGCFILVGAAKSGDKHGPHHSPTFDFDERMMPTGVAALASAAAAYLEQFDISTL